MEEINSQPKKQISLRVKSTLILFVIALIGLQFYKLYWPKTTLLLAGQTLHVLVADNAYRHHKGLGGRDTLAPYDGMLFVFDMPGKHGFVMRDTRFSLDIVWFVQGKVVDIASKIPIETDVPDEKLRRYYPRKPSTLVLELPAGWSEKHDLKIGDTLQEL